MRKLPALTALTLLLVGAHSVSALPKLTFSSYDAGAATLLTLSGSGIAPGTAPNAVIFLDDAVPYSSPFDFFDGGSFSTSSGLSNLMVTGAQSGMSLLISGSAGLGDHLELKFDGVGWTKGDAIALSGSAVLSIAFSNFNVGSGVYYDLRSVESSDAGYELEVAGVPDSGTTVALLGLALAGLAFVRRRIA